MDKELSNILHTTPLKRRSVPDDVERPAAIRTYYYITEESGTEVFTPQATLTSKGWIPPVPLPVLHDVHTHGKHCNDIKAFRYPFKSTRVIRDPTEVHQEISQTDAATIRGCDLTEVQPAMLFEKYETVVYYIPDELDVEQTAKYMLRTIPVLFTYFKRTRTDDYDYHEKARPTKPGIAAMLVMYYDIAEEEADRAVSLYSKLNPNESFKPGGTNWTFRE